MNVPSRYAVPMSGISGFTLPHDRWSSKSMRHFEQRSKPAVISAANALSEGQIPGFHRIGRAGGEPEDKFIFRAVKDSPQ